MRRILVALCLIALPLFASGEARETLLTPDGTLFTVESRFAQPENGASSAHLVLRWQAGTEGSEEIVPATLGEGAHLEPAVAYDAVSRTLFLFWLRYGGTSETQLLLAARDANGTWSEAVEFGQRWNYREKLRIAVTRRVTEQDGSLGPEAAISVHLVWWESNSDTGEEQATYAMVTIENGTVGTPEYLSLNQFAAKEKKNDEAGEAGADAEDETEGAETAAADANHDVLKQSLLFTSPKQDSVLVVFGSYETERLHQVTIRPTRPPVSDGRLRVPVGRAVEGSIGSPRLQAASHARVEGLYGDADRMALYTREGNRLEYSILKDGLWSDARTIVLDDQITSSHAVDALRRLISEH